MTRFQITPDYPSPILKDFQHFLAYFLDKKIKLTASGALTGKVCYELNARMTEPEPEVSTRTRHYYYPTLYLFHALALAGQLLKEEQKGNTVWIMPDLDRVEAFLDLPDTEQYFSMLEIFWIHTDWQELNDPERFRSPANVVHHMLKAISTLTVGGTTVLIDRFGKNDLGIQGFEVGRFSRYLELFGFWDARYEKYEGTRIYYLTECTPSLFGIEMARILTQSRKSAVWNNYESMYEDSLFLFDQEEAMSHQLLFATQTAQRETEAFITAFQPLFPEGELLNTLPFTQPKSREGNHIFKVHFNHLPKVWRRIAIPADHTLHDLHLQIQKAIKFDDDHLYAFYLNNKRHSRVGYFSPYGEEGPFADDCLIGELKINPGKAFLYFFDFGDSWELTVVLEETDSTAKPLKQAKVIESHGKAPKQYSY